MAEWVNYAKTWGRKIELVRVSSRDAFPRVTRCAMHFGALAALLGALLAAWTHRFERVPVLPVWKLQDFQAVVPKIPGVDWTGSADHPALRLKVDKQTPRVVTRFPIPDAPPVEWLHLRFRMSAKGLTPGRQPWEDGRFIIEWHPADGGPKWENDPIGGTRYNDRSDWREIVIQPANKSAVPMVRLEHLGISGEFQLSELEITVVRERGLWKYGRWWLAAAWMIWGASAIRGLVAQVSWRRALGASALMTGLGILFVVPGPWKIQRPMAPGFHIHHTEPVFTGKKLANVQFVTKPTPASEAPVSVGKIEVEGNLSLKVKEQVLKAKSLLHVILLFFPSLLLILIVGKRVAMILGSVFAVSIELGQIAFGYGCGVDDLWDLLCDGIGIVSAIWACHWLKKRGGALSLKNCEGLWRF